MPFGWDPVGDFLNSIFGQKSTPIATPSQSPQSLDEAAPAPVPTWDNTGAALRANQAVANIKAGGAGDVTTPYIPAAPAAPPRPPAPVLSTTDADIEKTAEYVDYLRRRAAAEKLFEAGQTTEKTRYEQDYGKALENLGWIADKNTWDQGELMSSGQKATTAGRAFNTLRNDYAARGMARSGAKQTAESLLRNQLNEQKTEQEKSRTKFLEDLTAKQTAFSAEQENAKAAARREAVNALKDKWAMDTAAWSGA